MQLKIELKNSAVAIGMITYRDPVRFYTFELHGDGLAREISDLEIALRKSEPSAMDLINDVALFAAPASFCLDLLSAAQEEEADRAKRARDSVL